MDAAAHVTEAAAALKEVLADLVDLLDRALPCTTVAAPCATSLPAAANACVCLFPRTCVAANALSAGKVNVDFAHSAMAALGCWIWLIVGVGKAQALVEKGEAGKEGEATASNTAKAAAGSRAAGGGSAQGLVNSLARGGPGGCCQ